MALQAQAKLSLLRYPSGPHVVGHERIHVNDDALTNYDELLLY